MPGTFVVTGNGVVGKNRAEMEVRGGEDNERLDIQMGGRDGGEKKRHTEMEGCSLADALRLAPQWWRMLAITIASP